MKKRRYKYDIALSFAEENRSFVELVAEQLRILGIRIFYDAHERLKNWGEDLDTVLDRVYREEARFCIVFISKDYKYKRWTQFEKNRALARSYYDRDRKYILPFRLDDTSIEGLPDNSVHLSKDQFEPLELAEAIAAKLKQVRDDERKIWVNLQKTLIKHRWWLLAALFVATCISFDLISRLSPVEVLAERLHEHSGRTFAVAVCRDGHLSRSRGSGTCSGHGGVDHYTDTVLFNKALEQCREEARKKSWWQD